MPAKTGIFAKITALQQMPENSRHFMKCQTGNRHLLKSAPNCLVQSLPGHHGMPKRQPALSESLICIKRLLLDAGGTGRCHIVVKTTGNVRYLTDHLTAECSTSLFVLQLCICDFSLLHRLCYHGPLRLKSCPKTFRSTLSFYEKDAVAGISLVFVRALNRHVAAADAVTKHTSLSPLAPFSCALFQFFFFL